MQASQSSKNGSGLDLYNFRGDSYHSVFQQLPEQLLDVVYSFVGGHERFRNFVSRVMRKMNRNNDEFLGNIAHLKLLVPIIQSLQHSHTNCPDWLPPGFLHNSNMLRFLTAYSRDGLCISEQKFVSLFNGFYREFLAGSIETCDNDKLHGLFYYGGSARAYDSRADSAMAWSDGFFVRNVQSKGIYKGLVTYFGPVTRKHHTALPANAEETIQVPTNMGYIMNLGKIAAGKSEVLKYLPKNFGFRHYSIRLSAALNLFEPGPFPISMLDTRQHDAVCGIERYLFQTLAVPMHDDTLNYLLQTEIPAQVAELGELLGHTDGNDPVVVFMFKQFLRTYHRL